MYLDGSLAGDNGFVPLCLVALAKPTLAMAESGRTATGRNAQMLATSTEEQKAKLQWMREAPSSTSPRSRCSSSPSSAPLSRTQAIESGALAGDLGFDPLGYSTGRSSLKHARLAMVCHAARRTRPPPAVDQPPQEVR